ncbi:hypothetical protein H634G_11124 [Metarhizium anisopliae BRIP 53293]|uniref:Uncharacterized protein n=1 Tax=Metarhizium anisopliae BRIP 53293 TaxID=1291518 RepID=A0A0D9NLZ1_METAN|nr:hypothetical protein H634G_11124 [Metarhizium anisopliae BRIP 53293]
MSCGSRDVVEADHYSLGGRLREPKSGFEALQRSFSLSVEHFRGAEVSCALADRASALVDSIAVSGSTAGVHGAVRIHDKSKRWDRLKPSVEVCGGLFFGCSLERLLCFVAIFARHEYGALAIPKQSLRPPQPGWKGLWRELLPPSPLFDTYDDLFAFLRNFHLSNGAAIVKASSSSRRDIGGIIQPSYIVFKCDRGPRRPSQSSGLRKPSSQKLDCPVKITAKATKSSN